MKKLALTTLFSAAVVILYAQDDDPGFSAGLLALKGGEHAAAFDAFDRSVEEHPQNARAWYYRGLSRDLSGDHLGAMNDLDHAVALEPTNANMLLRRADMYLNAGRAREARQDLEALLSRYPEGPIAEHALFSLGNAGVVLGEYDRALEAYDRLVRLAPADARARCDRGIALGHLQRHAEAVAELNTALSLDATLQQAYVARALALIALDRDQEACPDLRKAREMGDPSVDELLLIYCDRQQH